jgi:hypothetical protein
LSLAVNFRVGALPALGRMVPLRQENNKSAGLYLP